VKRATLWVAALVGTPWAALIFGVLALVSLPAALVTGSLVVIVGWIAQTFLQLVLLAVILFAQNEGAKATDATIRETHDALVGYLAEIHATTKSTHEIARATHEHVTNEVV